MKRLINAVAFLVPLFSAGTAHAVELCRYARLLPSASVTFEQSAAGFDQLGCRSQPSDSAHMRAWSCGTGADAVEVSMVRLVNDNLNMRVIVFAGANITSLDGFRSCRVANPIYRRTTISGEPPFDPESILVQDQFALDRFSDLQVTFLGISGPGVIVAGFPGSSITVAGRVTPVTLAERGMFGVTRGTYSSTAVEIAGQNLFSSPAQAIIAALESRGATVTGHTVSASGALHITTLSPPTGLEGVSRVQVQHLNRHTLMVSYFLRAEADYTAFVGLLDGRYGRSTVRNGTQPANRTCRFRTWRSGVVRIVGEYCPDTGYAISFNNDVTTDQLSQTAAHRPDPEPRRRPQIDPDNL